MSSFFDRFLSKQQCDFRKGYSTQQCLLTSLENWIRVVDNGQMFGALLTDLSKAFDCLDHELLITRFPDFINRKYFTLILKTMTLTALVNSAMGMEIFAIKIG